MRLKNRFNNNSSSGSIIMMFLPKKYRQHLFAQQPCFLPLLLTTLCLISTFGQFPHVNSASSNSQREQPLPTVLLPSVFHWDSNNIVYVTPADTGPESVDITLRVQGENANGEKRELYSETARSAKGMHAFKMPLPRLDSRSTADGTQQHLISNFYITIQVSRHQSYSAVLSGASDVRQIHLQTDKVFYRPEERVNIRALPLTGTGQLYKGPIQFQLLDPNGFRIFNKTNSANVHASNQEVELDDGENSQNGKEMKSTAGFLAEYFDLPKFLRFGDWRVLAFAVDDSETNVCSSTKFQQTIRVRKYDIPKFHVFMDIEEGVETPMLVKINVLARFAHGMLVNGDLTLRCLINTRNSGGGNSSSNANLDGATLGTSDNRQRHYLPPPPAKNLFILVPLTEGRWSGHVNLNECAAPGQITTTTAKIQIGAEVLERGTFQTGITSREWEPFVAGFEMIPLRPAFTERTLKLQIFLRLLSTLSSIRNGRAELISQCISEDRSVNGLNQSMVQRLGTIVELDVDNKCMAYVIRARRKMADGNFSAIQTLVMPSLRGIDSLDMSLIQMQPNRVDYMEGEMLEARVPTSIVGPLNTFNYAFYCNNEVIVADRIAENGRILVPITARLPTGHCVLYVYGPKWGTTPNAEKQMAVDMRLFYVRTGECPDEHYGMRLSQQTNQTVGAQLNVTLRAPANSLATLHAYDSRLKALLRPSTALTPTPTNGQLWTFTEFLMPDPDEQRTLNTRFTWFSNLLNLAEVVAKRKLVCQTAGKFAPQCPDSETNDGTLVAHLQRHGRQYSTTSAASRLSDDCQREMMKECERQKSIRDSAAPFIVENMQRRPPPPGILEHPRAPPPEPAVKIASNVAWMLKAPQSTQLQQTPAVWPSELQELKNAIRDGQQTVGKQQEEEVTLRDFFPEVWLFNDYHIGTNGTRELQLRTPHSVTEWHFSPRFWTSGRADVCQTGSQSLFVQRDVFMDVEVPLHININETIQVQVTVSAERLNEAGRRMAICFRGLSPSVCGDVGRDGTLGETEFTRIELTAQKPVQQKSFFVRFLRPGMHNLSFELRAEEILRGHDWHCRDGSVQIFDRIVKQIHVRLPVDLEEHYRQIVVYRRRRILDQQHQGDLQPTLEQVLGENISSSSTVPPAPYWLLQSSPDVISYIVQQPMGMAGGEDDEDGQTRRASVQTRVQINAAGRRVYMVGVEFSKFVASFPPALSTELLAVTSALTAVTGGGQHSNIGGLHRLRNRPALNSLVPVDNDRRVARSAAMASSSSLTTTITGKRNGKQRKKGSKGKRKKTTKRRMAEEVQHDDGQQQRPLQGYSLPNLLKELAQISYELKSLRKLLSSEDGSATTGNNNNNAAAAVADDEATELLDRLDQNWMRTRERTLGNLLAELLTFSDCNGGQLMQRGTKSSTTIPACGFGEFGKPAKAAERSLVLTTLATSLLCEQRTSDEFICGPIKFLAQSVGHVLNGSGSNGDDDWGLDSFVQFSSSVDRRLFVEALMVQAALDCSAYVCTAEAWKQLHASFYRSVDLNTRYDVRVVAALAYMSTAGIRSIMRSKLASQTRNDDHVPFWAMDGAAIGSSGGAHNLLERSLQRSSNVLVNALALLAYTQDQNIYRSWKNEFDLEALGNWLIEQQDHNRQYENALDTFFAARALHQFSSVNSRRHMRQVLAGTVNANFTILQHRSPPVVLGSHQFRDGDLPFTMALPSAVDQMDLETKGDSRILLGVRVLMEKRKRSRRDDPSGADMEPVTLKLEQKRTQPGYITQTVTIVTHSQRLRTLQIEHGLFTGFSSQPNFIQILTTPINYFQIEPRVSPTAVHFVMTNLSQETAAVYTVTLMEPSGGYSPTNLAPIAISAMHHHLPLGQLIVLPEEVDFLGGSDAERHLGIPTTAQQQRRKRRSISPGGRQRFPGSSSDAVAPPPAHFQVADSFLTQLDSVQRQQPIQPALPPAAPSSSFLQMITERTRQATSEVVETVCLQNGACTCAELSCTVKCTTECEHLSFDELCDTINGPDGQKFVLFFRIQAPVANSIRQVHVGAAEYTLVQNVQIVEWKSDVVTQKPEHLTLWIRNCNMNCLKMVTEQQQRNGGSKKASGPRYLLIGDPKGLFDESSGSSNEQHQREFDGIGTDDDVGEEQNEEDGADANNNDDEEGEAVNGQRQQRDRRRRSRNNNKKSGSSSKLSMQMQQTHYLMRDNDRLLRSTDCYELFGKVADESCTAPGETDE